MNEGVVAAPAMPPVEAASELMASFAERTGLSSSRTPTRYLWTDAFAVCNCLSLARETGRDAWLQLALRLVDQVHQTLGRHRPDDAREGWISGLSEEQGAEHPTAGGLRIGKKLPERGDDELFDEELEWDRDGQYFHYLTRWMHALDQVARVTKEPRFNLWARELADVAFRKFVTAHGRSMVWKMSVDLSHPSVPTMGHHDPLEGFLLCAQLRFTAALLHGAPVEPTLDEAMEGFGRLIVGREWTTADPLGLGGLLMDGFRAWQLRQHSALPGEEDLVATLLEDAIDGLGYYVPRGDLRAPAFRRLGFRELGLAIGLHAVPMMESEVPAGEVRQRVESLMALVPVSERIEKFWLDPANRAARTWTEHRDINEVMLATSLLPAGTLVLVA